jgi:hypothetical protein
MDDNIYDFFKSILKSLSLECEDSEQIMKLWVQIGREMGVDIHLPHLKFIQVEDSNDQKKVVAVVGCYSEDVVEYISSEAVFSDEVLEIIHNELNKEIVH